MLIVSEDVVVFKVLHDRAHHDVLHELDYDACQEDRPVIGRIVLLLFLEDRRDVCTSPV